ncbi:MAG: hypothetical protein JO040_10835, partial [Gemmatimonadetes bacterium]|nr:hypothetical protein [Gemmatimonadota bacterium]
MPLLPLLAALAGLGLGAAVARMLLRARHAADRAVVDERLRAAERQAAELREAVRERDARVEDLRAEGARLQSVLAAAQARGDEERRAWA